MNFSNSNSSNKLGIAIAGLGFGESVHIPALNSNTDLDLVTLWHPRNERLKIATEKHQVEGTSSWHGLLDDPNINGIIIATPPEPRFKLAYEALEAGKHLLLEKPVAINSDQIQELQKIAIKNRLSVAVDFEYRAVPLFMQAKRIISRGDIGDPWLIKFDWLMSSRVNKSRPWNWYSDVNQGGGVLGALGTHAFDILHWFFGPTEAISASISTSIQDRLDTITGKNKIVTSEDVVLANVEIKNISSNQKIPLAIALSSVAREGRGCWIEIYGSEGSVKLGNNNQKDYVHGFGLWFTQREENTINISADQDLVFSKTWTDGRIAPVARLQNWWAQSIRTGSPIIPGLAEGYASQRACEMSRESDQSGQKIYY